MAATGVNLNWTNVSYQPTGASPILIKRVTNCAFNLGGNVITFSGDTNLYDVVAAVGVNKPTASITTADIGTIMCMTPGQYGVLSATIQDAYNQNYFSACAPTVQIPGGPPGANGGVGGGVVFQMSQAVVNDPQSSGAHAAFGTATVTFLGVTTDGLTPPITITRV
jgi:hypothetical protein